MEWNDNMRGSKWLSIITLGVSSIALIGVLILHSIEYLSLAYDISLAILGSALLGFIMSLVEYFAVKRIAMETFYQEALKAVSALSKAKYFFTDEPTGLVVNCIAEEWSNKWSAPIGGPPQRESKDKLIENYRQGFPPEIANNLDFNEHNQTWYAEKMHAYYKELDECFDSYIEISAIHLGELDNAYGNLDFIFANGTLRRMAYEQVYEPIKEQRKSALRQAYHFQLYKDGEGNISACTAFILKLNEEWFLTKEVNNDDIHSIAVYRKCSDALLDATEEFRCKIYKQKYEPEEHYPIISKIYRIKHRDE